MSLLELFSFWSKLRPKKKLLWILDSEEVHLIGDNYGEFTSVARN